LSIAIFAAIVACVSASCEGYNVDVHDSRELKKALEEARPGAYITLAPGKYKGSFTVTNSGSDDNCAIIIDGNNAATLTSSDKWAFSFNNVSYVTLKNVAINHLSDYGVMLMGSKGVYIYNVDFSDIDYTAVVMVGSSSNTVSKCTFNNIRHSCVWIGLDTSSSKNTVQSCDFQSGLSGEIIVLDSLASGNQIKNNGFNGKSNNKWSCWIHVKGSDNLISQNLMSYEGKNPNFAQGVFCAGNSNKYQENSMVINDGEGKYGFYNEGSNEHICVSNSVGGGTAQFTNKDTDKNC